MREPRAFAPIGAPRASERFRFAELPADAVLTTREVALWLQLTVRQVQRLAIPWVDCGLKNRRYVVADVRAWIEAHRTGGRGGLMIPSGAASAGAA